MSTSKNNLFRRIYSNSVEDENRQNMIIKLNRQTEKLKNNLKRVEDASVAVSIINSCELNKQALDDGQDGREVMRQKNKPKNSRHLTPDKV